MMMRIPWCLFPLDWEGCRSRDRIRKKVAQMLDRSKQLSHAEGIFRIKTASGAFLPVACFPSRDGRPARVVWMEFEGMNVDRPVQNEDLDQPGSARAWFVTDWSACRPKGESERAPLDGLIFHVARCGSTLAQRMLGVIPDLMVHWEPAVVTQALADPASTSLEGILSAYRDVAQRRGERVFIKCTSSNLLQSERLLDCVPDAPAIFIHRDPGEVLASVHGGAWYERLPESMRDPEGCLDPDEGNGRYLEALMQAGLRLAEAGRVRCVEYPDLVGRLVDGDLPEHFGYRVDATIRERMLAVSVINSKQPEATFQIDTDRKARIVADVPAIGREAERLKPLHEALRHWSVPP